MASRIRRRARRGAQPGSKNPKTSESLAKPRTFEEVFESSINSIKESTQQESPARTKIQRYAPSDNEQEENVSIKSRTSGIQEPKDEAPVIIKKCISSADQRNRPICARKIADPRKTTTVAYVELMDDENEDIIQSNRETSPLKSDMPDETLSSNEITNDEQQNVDESNKQELSTTDVPLTSQAENGDSAKKDYRPAKIGNRRKTVHRVLNADDDMTFESFQFVLPAPIVEVQMNPELQELIDLPIEQKGETLAHHIKKLASMRAAINFLLMESGREPIDFKLHNNNFDSLLQEYKERKAKRKMYN